MHKALATEAKSLHPDHKVGALIYKTDKNGQEQITARHNFWPGPLLEKLGTEKKLGNASTTVHAEVAAILTAPVTEDAEIYITNFPCPNCAKMIAESRIKKVYIDFHTHQNTPLGKKMHPFFESVSKPILESANIAVEEILYPRHATRTIIKTNPARAIKVSNPVQQTLIDNMSAKTFQTAISQAQKKYPKSNFALCFAQSPLQSTYLLLAQKDFSLGMDERKAKEILSTQDKYTPSIQPMNRVLATAARLGLRIMPEYVYSAHTPTSREWVNLIGANLTTITIGNPSQCRDHYGLEALETLKKNKIIKINQTS